MIIDLILDRIDGEQYQPARLYRDCMEYGKTGHEITRAMDGGTESDVKRAINKYLNVNGYQVKNIIDYVKQNNWI